MGRTTSVAGILLVGGLSSRMGRDKAMLPLMVDDERPGSTFVTSLATLLCERCREVVLVARDEEHAERYRHLDLPTCVRVVVDVEKDKGPLMGLYSGLRAINASHALVSAVDMPFVQLAVLDFLLAQPLDDAITLPFLAGAPQVLLAVYPRTLLPVIEMGLRAGRRGPRSLLEQARVRYVEEERLRAIDPKLRSFVNINTPDELRREGLEL